MLKITGEGTKKGNKKGKSQIGKKFSQKTSKIRGGGRKVRRVLS